MRAIVVGFGHLGNFHAQKYKSLAGVELIALVDPAGESLRTKANKIRVDIPIFESVSAYCTAVDQGKISLANLASIACTTDHHLTASLPLIKRGVHLLVEKPLALSSAQGAELVAAAEAAKVILATGQVERHRVVELYSDIKGHPYFIECHRLSPFPARSTDIDVIFDLMIHDIDLMLAMVDSPIKHIHAAGFPVLTSQIDIANCRFEFENGCIANLTASRISLGRTRKFRIFCSDSYLSLDLGAGTYERYIKNAQEKDISKAIAHSSGSLKVEDALLEEIRDFVDAIKEKRNPLVSGKDGLRAIQVAEEVVHDIQDRLTRLPVGRKL